jgi:glutamine amidotransferase-like uncharacterized protein
MRNEILILNEHPASTGSLTKALADDFPGMAQRMIDAASLHSGALNNPHVKMFVIPGVYGDVSPYPAKIGEDGLNRIRDFAARGGVVFTICASTYYVSRETVFEPDWGTHKRRQTVNYLFNAQARGPLPKYGRAPDRTDPKFGDVTIVPLLYKTLSGVWRDVHACYGNGPGLYLDNPLDTDTDVLGKFTDVKDSPAALVRHRIGKGAIYLSCILPEIGYRLIPPGQTLPYARTLMDQLKPYERGRFAMWYDLTERMKLDF